MLAPGAIELRAVSNGVVLASTIATPPEASRPLIVRFAAPPAAEARLRNVDPEISRAPYRRFLADLAGIGAVVEAESGRRAATVRVRRRFESSFNGVAITASPALAGRLGRLPYVAAIYPDDSVYAVLDQSVTHIKADSLRAALGLSGSGIVVSIVDTGIDYGHPALGGCFGPNCRVIGGYDFVGDDADPMDDNGHGTHVAGIVGGNGAGIVGVAPGARLLAYKVLDASGGGTVSDVIAGIDRSLDPDGDPLTDDAADLINLSIGGPGDADGPLAQAIDQAVAAGVACVAAAGNSGGYLTIGSAGSARRAITVGAATAGDRIASFSSRGPAAPDHAIKPDVVAPGVDIASAWLDGGARALSGTSMATPHATGVAALLLELHPGWTPGAVKSALMNTAVDLGVDPFQQGAGRIDALAAGRAHVTIEPASLSFGLSPVTASAWTAVETLTVRNHDAGARVVSFSTVSDLPPGSSLEVLPASLALEAGETRNVVATLTLDHAPALPNAPYAYTGSLRASLDQSTLRVPFAVLRTPQLALRVDDMGLVIVHDRSGFNLSSVMGGPGTLRLFLPAGTYDAMAFLGYDGRVVREGIVLADTQTVDLRQADAVHTVRRVCIDEQGDPVSLPIGIESLRHHGTGIGIVSFGGLSSTSRFSTIGPAYDLEWHRLSYGQELKTYDFQGFQRGVSASTVAQNAPGDLRHATLAYHPSPGVRQLIPVRWVSNGPRGVVFGNGFAVSSITNTAPLPPLEPPFTQEAYFMATPDPDLHYQSRVYAAYPYLGAPHPAGTPELETPYLVADPGEPLLGFLYGDDTRPVVSVETERLEIGFGPPTWFGGFQNRPDQMRLSPRAGYAGWLFLMQQAGWRDHSQLPFELSREGTLVETGTLTGRLTRALAPGAHALTIVNDRYWIAGERGRATVVAAFNSLASDPDPPYLGDLAVLVNGAPSDVAGEGASSVVRFTVEDAVALGSVALASRSSETAPWSPLPASRSGNRFEAALPAVPGGSLSLRIEAGDATGNRLTYSIEPAIAFRGAAADPPPVVEVLSPNGGESWEAGSTQIITWDATDNVGVTAIDLAYSLDGGATFPHLIASGVDNTGSRSWTVPGITSTSARVHVAARDAAGNTARDSSALDFSIVDRTPPLVTLTAPNGGERWLAGTEHEITWSATDNVAVSMIDLAYSTDGGASYPHVIASGIAHSGSFAWTLPDVSSATLRVRVTARDASGNVSHDASDADFASSASPNLVGNGGFESNLDGWSTYGRATFSLAGEGRSGTHSLRIHGTSSSSFGCDDWPNWVGAVAAKGAVYRMSAWVKSPTGSRGRARIRLYEYLGSSQQGSTAYSNEVRLSGAWRLLSLDYAVRTAGSTLSMRVADSPASSGETFLVDDVSIELLGPAVPDAPPIVSAPASVSGSPGEAIRFAVTASDPDGQPIASLIANGKPPAATFTSSSTDSATFAWTPTAADVSSQPYVVTFVASNNLSGQASTSISVTPAAGTVASLSRRVASGEDDAEERPPSSMSIASSDLELTEDGAPQTIGIRFRDVQVPAGAAIAGAHIQFQADESHSGVTNLTIRGELSPNPGPYSSANTITGRTRTAAAVQWSDLPAWSTGDRGPAQKTPDLKLIVQEIVGQGGWQSGNALAVIIDGAGKRVAESFEGNPTGAAELVIEYSTGGGTVTNQPPVVDAGPGRTIAGPPVSAMLDGTVSDDGLPWPASLTSLWSATGPGVVTFDHADSVDTRATFSATGAYVLRLEASDGEEKASDTTTVHVVPQRTTATLDRRVGFDDDDAEENTGGGVDLSSSDLELTEDGSAQVIGIRFRNVTIPNGAVITHAELQFQVDEEGDRPTTLDIMGQATDDAPPFTTRSRDISSRERTESVTWSNVPPWPSRGAQGPDQRSPDIGAVIQAIVSRQGWRSGSALALIIEGSGKRVAESHDGEPNGAPLLHVEYALPAAASAIGPIGFEPATQVTGPTRAMVAPNPMRGAGSLRLALAQAGMVRVRVLDIQGRQVQPSVVRSLGVGEHVIRLAPERGERLGPGLYFYRVEAPDALLSGRFVVVE